MLWTPKWVFLLCPTRGSWWFMKNDRTDLDLTLTRHNSFPATSLMSSAQPVNTTSSETVGALASYRHPAESYNNTRLCSMTSASVARHWNLAFWVIQNSLSLYSWRHNTMKCLPKWGNAVHLAIDRKGMQGAQSRRVGMNKVIPSKCITTIWSSMIRGDQTTGHDPILFDSDVLWQYHWAWSDVIRRLVIWSKIVWFRCIMAIPFSMIRSDQTHEHEVIRLK